MPASTESSRVASSGGSGRSWFGTTGRLRRGRAHQAGAFSVAVSAGAVAVALLVLRGGGRRGTSVFVAPVLAGGLLRGWSSWPSSSSCGLLAAVVFAAPASPSRSCEAARSCVPPLLFVVPLLAVFAAAVRGLLTPPRPRAPHARPAWPGTRPWWGSTGRDRAPRAPAAQYLHLGTATLRADLVGADDLALLRQWVGLVAIGIAFAAHEALLGGLRP